MSLAEWCAIMREMEKQNGAGEMTQARFDALLDDAKSRYDWIKR